MIKGKPSLVLGRGLVSVLVMVMVLLWSKSCVMNVLSYTLCGECHIIGHGHEHGHEY